MLATHIIIYQDRIADEGKSQPRFAKDKELLLREIQRDPNDSRSMFYLGQSCECLNQPEDALYYYKLRSMQTGYEDERFHSFLRGGDNAARLNHDVFEVMKWYLKAYHHSKRAEPLVKIGNIFQALKDHKGAAMFYREAADLEFPEARLFVDNNAYEFERHFRMGISGFWAGRHHEGKMGCIRAAATGQMVDLNNNNLKFYQDKEKELAKTNRTQYILARIRERLELEPSIPWEQANKWAVAEWEKAFRGQ
jgi:tetratricopeptide (TPR) repeat protein